MRENHYAIFAHLENFSGFHPQDKHNASYLFVCNGIVLSYPTANVIKRSEKMIMVSEYSFLRVRSPVGTGDDGVDGRSGPAMTEEGNRRT